MIIRLKPRIRRSRWGAHWVCAVPGDSPIAFGIGFTPASAYANWVAQTGRSQ